MENKELIKKKFGSTLLSLRKSGELTQQEVAEEAEISRRYYIDLEQGKKMPTLDVVMKLGSVYGLSLSKICERIKNEF